MTPEQFVYWLQGYFELSDDTDRLTRREHIIRDHLSEVFEKRTPNRTEEINQFKLPQIVLPDGSGSTLDPNTHKIVC